MYKVVKCFEFEAAHRLIETCTEKCKRIHGHTYKLEVELSAEELGPDQMVCDFTKLNQFVKEGIIEEFDHVLIEKAPKRVIKEIGDCFVYETDKRMNRTKVFLKEQPTAEYMCKLFFDVLTVSYSLPVTRIRLWETSNSYAEYVKA